MFNKCGGPVPHLERLQNEPFLQQPYAPSSPVMPSVPGSGAPATPYPPYMPEAEPFVPSLDPASGATQMPNALNPLVPVNPDSIANDINNMPGADSSYDSNLVNPPGVIANPPSFQVPANPLLPPGYQETITYNNLQYLNGFLRTQIGRRCEVEFLIGSNDMVNRTGKLLAVGLNYILIQDLQTDDVISCDYYSIKFVRFYY